MRPDVLPSWSPALERPAFHGRLSLRRAAIGGGGPLSFQAPSRIVRRAPGMASDSLVKVAVMVWALALLAVCARSAIDPHRRSLYATWAAAGGNWVAGANAYDTPQGPHLSSYRYAPPVTALLAPWYYLPERLGNVLWRLGNAAAVLGAFAWWLRSAAPMHTTPRQRGLLYLLLVPLSLNNLNNAQSNLLLAALLLAALAAVARERFWVAGLCVAFAVALKGYPLAVGLLILAAYPRRFAAPLLFGLAVVAALPFLLQGPEYVAQQYLNYYEGLRHNEARRHWPSHVAYRDLWLLLRVWQVPISAPAYQAVQVLAGAGCAAVVALGRWRGWSSRRVLEIVFVLGTCWMMACGPATESSTYALLGPALAWWLFRAGQERSPAPRALVQTAAGLLLLCVLSGLTPHAPRFHALALHPLAVLLLAGSYLLAGALASASNVLAAPSAALEG